MCICVVSKVEVRDDYLIKRPRIDFRTFYENSEIWYIDAIYSGGYDELRLTELEVVRHNGTKHTLTIAPNIKLDMGQVCNTYGIAVEEKRNCFFLHSWQKGVYCFDLKNGKLLWHYKLKHAERVFLYADYVIGAFEGRGLKKISYDGEELSEYKNTVMRDYFPLEDAYFFVGPKRGNYEIIDTRNMEVIKRIRKDKILPEGVFLNGDIPLRDLKTKGVTGTPERFEIRGRYITDEDVSPPYMCIVTGDTVKIITDKLKGSSQIR